MCSCAVNKLFTSPQSATLGLQLPTLC